MISETLKRVMQKEGVVAIVAQEKSSLMLSIHGTRT